MSLTVLMTIYNCAPYISQAIKSILYQTYKDFEFLIVDDGSTDITEEVVRQFQDKRIRYIKRQHYGRAASLNFGLKNASNDLIALMDGDDISHPERFEKQLKNYFNKTNEIIFLSVAYFRNNRVRFTGDVNITEEKFYQNLALHGPYNNSTALFNKNHIMNNGGYNESLFMSEDHDLWLRLKDISIYKQIREILYFIRLRDSSLSHNHFLKTNNITYNILEKYYNNLTDNFKLNSIEEEIQLRGWREFFYGNIPLMRPEWRKLKISIWNYRMLIAYLISFLPAKIINLMKFYRFRLRFHYWFQRISNADAIQKRFGQVLNLLND
ncbi:MAG TPA: glycosyltransferase family 2 protein [Ignavibacteriaceae bacterium]|nr:glycosyltransferase family 2 protein [Ignavibacteriaceae bacterium]